MTTKEKIIELKKFLDQEYFETSCFLYHENELQLLIAIILSAQAQDKVVNKVTPLLFKRYPSIDALADASYEELLSYIKEVGLGPSKARNIIALAKDLKDNYNSIIPHDRETLTKLNGVGNKTAAVFLSELNIHPYIPVDTHIKRVSLRLGLSKKDNPDYIESVLEKNYPYEDMINFHRQMILFGRNICLASKKRQCHKCPLKFCKDRLEDK